MSGLGRFQSWGELGGQNAVTQGLDSTATVPIAGGTPSEGTGVQASYPGCAVTVFLTGTTTLASIYSDNLSTPTPLSNPFTANTNGSFGFYASPNNIYDVTISGGGLPAPFTYSGVSLPLPAGTPSRVAALQYTIDGGGSVPGTGAKGQLSIPAGCTVTGWVLTADQSGSAVVDVLRSTFAGFPGSLASIAGSQKPTLASAQSADNLAVSNWTTALNAGDQIQFYLDSVTTVTRLNVTINLTIP